MATGTSDWTTWVIAVAVLALSPAAAQVGAPVWNPDAGDGTFRNPVLYADYSDPDVVRSGDDYFMVSSSFTSVPGLPILHSRDLVNWELVNHALPRLVPEEVFRKPQHGAGVWAPAIRRHDGKYWIYYPDPDHGIYLVTADDPRGEWSAPVLVKKGKGLIDPCPLWDEDGSVYLVHAFARSRAGFANVLHLNRLTPDGLAVADAGRIVIDGNAIPGYTTLEGPKLYKRNGWYYVFAPAGGVKQGWQSVFRARDIAGPYQHRIVLAQGKSDVNGPHQGALVDTPDGDSWFIHFQDAEAYGRVVHMQPVTWRDDWPVIGDDGDGDGAGEPRRVWKKPSLTAQRAIAPPTSDAFRDRRLGLQWQWQANPLPAWWSFPKDRDGLLLAAIPSEGNLWSAPNLLLQKFAAPEFTATAVIDAGQLRDGERAGLIVFGTDYAWAGIERTAGQLRVVLRRVADAPKGGAEEVVASEARATDRLRIEVSVATGGICTFAVAPADGTLRRIGPAFQAKPGRWVGARIGLFAAAPASARDTGHLIVRSFLVGPLGH